MYATENEDCEPRAWRIHEVFTTYESCHLMKDKNMVGHWEILYTLRGIKIVWYKM